jgi:hypothetical protein
MKTNINRLKDLRNKISNIWQHTEMELDDLSRSGLKKQLYAVSREVNDLVVEISTEIETSRNYTCSSCESDQVSMCEPCLNEMEQKI